MASFVQLDERAGPNFGLRFSTDNEMTAAVRTNVMRYEASGTFDTSFWSTTFAGSGTATITLGEMVVETGTTANSSSIVQSFQTGRQMAGATEWLIDVIRLSDTGTANNIRRWGVFNANDGFFWELNGTTMNVVTRYNGTDVNRIPFASWNGDVVKLGTWSPSNLVMGNEYEIYFGSLSCRFLINGRTAHMFPAGTTTTPLTSQLNLPFRYENVNSGGSASDVQLLSRGPSFHRMSPFAVSPRYAYITSVTTTTLKTRPGALIGFIVGSNSSGSTATFYDSMTGSGTKIHTSPIDAITGRFVSMGGIETENGITVVTAGGPTINLTVLFA